jgi:hypothetical protein
MQKRTVTQWLELWGEWERKGSKPWNLGSKSSMLSIDAGYLKSSTWVRAMANDDEAWWLHSIMIEIKNKRLDYYEYLFDVHAERKTFVTIGYEKTPRIDWRTASKNYGRAVAYVECLFEQKQNKQFTVLVSAVELK